jgi:hypothetical protein
MKQNDVYPLMTRGFLEIEGEVQLIILKKALDSIGSNGKSKDGEHLPDFMKSERENPLL